MGNIYFKMKRLKILNVPIIIASIFLLNLLPVASYQQFTKLPAIGLHLQSLHFHKSDSLYSSNSAIKMGLAVSYQNNLSPRFVYNTTLSGAFVEARKNNGNKELLLQADFLTRANYFKSNTIFNPYAQAGAGISKYINDYNLVVPVGIGCQINVTPDMFLLINSQYRFSSDSKYNHWVNSIGIAGVIRRKKISKIKQVPLPVASTTVINPADTDGDGILDKDDSCRLLVGIIKYHGCPPPARLAEITEVKRQLDIAATKIFFETGSARLLKESYAPLNEVVQILKVNLRIQLVIEGHTDSEGTPASNQLLSENRAQTVLNYLVRSGININRLKFQGFGQAKPIADNSTAEGRAKNRRVELKAL
jgi:OOP family OmpA-OmpF porin